jgi:hypothetical protein
MRALCLGSAACVYDDLAMVRALGVSQDRGWVLVAVNQIAAKWNGPVDHWATFHPEKLQQWKNQRHAAGLPPAGEYWTATRRVIPNRMEINRVPNWGGSSGLLAARVALELGATHVVLCGIPLDYAQGHFNTPAIPWREGGSYRRGWVEHALELTRVKSSSGWTRELLGAPTAEWLAEEPPPCDTGAMAGVLDETERRGACAV